MNGITLSLAFWAALLVCCGDIIQLEPSKQMVQSTVDLGIQSNSMDVTRQTCTQLTSFNLGRLPISKKTPEQVHSWYPRECCMQLDCAPLDITLVRRTDLGWYLVESRETLSFNDFRVRPSPDAQFHRCRQIFWEPESDTRCLFVPGIGMI